jgi:hypothetical protein
MDRNDSKKSVVPTLALCFSASLIFCESRWFRPWSKGTLLRCTVHWAFGALFYLSFCRKRKSTIVFVDRVK